MGVGVLDATGVCGEGGVYGIRSVFGGGSRDIECQRGGKAVSSRNERSNE